MEKEGSKTNNLGVASVIFGVLSIIFSIGINVHGIVLGIIGLIFAVIQKKKFKNSWSKAGIILSIIGIVINIAIFAWLTTVIAGQIKDIQAAGGLPDFSQLQQYGQ
jgi:hypothetical protein